MSSNMSIVESAKVSIDAADLRGLQPIVGAPVGGAFSVNAEANGPLDRLTGSLRAVASNVVYQDQRIDRLQLTADARDAPSNAQGSLALDAATSLGSVTARGAFGMEGPDRLRIDRFVLTYAEALTATARLLVPFNGHPIVGNVAVRSDDLTPVGRALNQQLGGRFNLDLSLDGARGTQQLPQISAATISATVPRRADGRRRRAQSRHRTLRRAGRAPAAGQRQCQQHRCRRRAAGDGDGAGDRAANAYQVHAAAQGDLQGLTQLTADADISPGETTAITLRRLQAMLRGEALRLVRPARIAFGADRMQADDLAITYGKAQATVRSEDTAEGRGPAGPPRCRSRNHRSFNLAPESAAR